MELTGLGLVPYGGLNPLRRPRGKHLAQPSSVLAPHSPSCTRGCMAATKFPLCTHPGQGGGCTGRWGTRMPGDVQPSPHPSPKSWHGLKAQREKQQTEDVPVTRAVPRASSPKEHHMGWAGGSCPGPLCMTGGITLPVTSVSGPRSSMCLLATEINVSRFATSLFISSSPRFSAGTRSPASSQLVSPLPPQPRSLPVDPLLAQPWKSPGILPLGSTPH